MRINSINTDCTAKKHLELSLGVNWKSKVGRTEIDKFRGAIQGEFEQGIFFTTANFSKDAQNVTRKSGAGPITLIDGISLVDIMIDKKFGIESENIPVYINALDRALTDSD